MSLWSLSYGRGKISILCNGHKSIHQLLLKNFVQHFTSKKSLFLLSSSSSLNWHTRLRNKECLFHPFIHDMHSACTKRKQKSRNDFRNVHMMWSTCGDLQIACISLNLTIIIVLMGKMNPEVAFLKTLNFHLIAFTWPDFFYAIILMNFETKKYFYWWKIEDFSLLHGGSWLTAMLPDYIHVCFSHLSGLNYTQ